MAEYNPELIKLHQRFDIEDQIETEFDRANRKRQIENEYNEVLSQHGEPGALLWSRGFDFHTRLDELQKLKDRQKRDRQSAEVKAKFPYIYE